MKLCAEAARDGRAVIADARRRRIPAAVGTHAAGDACQSTAGAHDVLPQ